MNYLSAFYTLIFIASGFCVSCRLFKGEGAAERLMLGICGGLFFMMWLPALFSFVLNFALLSQILSIVAAIAIAAVLGFLNGVWGLRPQTGVLGAVAPKVSFLADLRRDKYAALAVVPIFIIIAWLLPSHVLRPAAGALHVGQSTYGDLNLHAALITSIAEQGVFPPQYSLLAGDAPVGYPFLCDSVSSTLYVLGADLRTSYIVPMIFASLCLVMAVFVFFRSWLGREKGQLRSVFATFLFFIGGGFGFVYFLEMSKGGEKLKEMLSAFYHTPMNFNEHNIRWSNVIADMIIPQRATLFGWAMLVPCLFLLVRAVFDGKKAYFAPLAVVAGGLPLIHTHSFLALGIISVVLFVYKACLKDWKTVKAFALFGVTAVVLAAPQLILFTFRQSSTENFIKFHFNWVNDKDNYFWFYIKNMGLIYILAVPAFIHAQSRQKWLFGAGCAVLLICEFIVFQPNNYDNNKLIFVWYLLLCGLSADFMADVYNALKSAKIRGRVFIAAAVAVVCNISGALTLAREYVSDYELFSREHVAAAAFIRENTPKDALFLTADNHNNAVASLTGRNIVCGAATFLYFHGIDYSGHKEAAYTMFREPSKRLFAENGVNYAYISDFERGVDGLDISYFDENCAIVYKNNTVTIYKLD